MTLSNFITTYRDDYLWPFVRSAPLRYVFSLGSRDATSADFKQLAGPVARFDRQSPTTYSSVKRTAYLSLPTTHFSCTFYQISHDKLPALRPWVSWPGCVGLRYSTVPTPEQLQERGITLEQYEKIMEARRRCQAEADAAVELHAGRSGPHTPAATYTAPTALVVARNDRNAENLKQLQEKHPYLFNIIRSCPPDDLVARVFKDRYRSVYQVDYCKQGEYPNSEYDALVAGSGLSGCAPGALPYCPCRAAKDSVVGGRLGVVGLDRNKQLMQCEALPARAMNEGDIEVCLCGLEPKRPAFGRKCSISCQMKVRPGSTRDTGSSESGGPNQYRTEYRDTYNRLGSFIMSEQIHCPDRNRRRAGW